MSQNLNEEKTITAEELVKKIIKGNPRFKWLKDDLPKNYTINDVKDALDDAGYSKEYSKYIKEGEEINEGKTQIKRKYGEHGAINVYERGPIRNKIIEFVKHKFVTETELKEFVQKLAEERGSDFDANKWFKRNERYFESFQNRGQQVYTLSKFGKRIYEFIVKKQNQKQVNESIGLFKSEMINENKEVNEALNQGKASELANMILNKLVDMEILKPKDKSVEAIEAVTASILNYRG